ncbi:DMT family transporter [Olsenella sp. HMSC062G07]|uniref:DMT family transporter n=1 Tax=Olsenella sp. HMSC062G07 TaxID=1739330 RepID=UPI001FEEC4A1|nr:DMT family transporter [Olsenella sp. HMSC062G07]
MRSSAPSSRLAMTDARRSAVAATGRVVPRVFVSSAGVLALNLLCCLLWGSAFPCIKLGYALFSVTADDTGSKLLFAGVRFFLAGLMVVVLMSALRRRVVRPRPDELPVVALLALFQTVLQYLFFYLGLSHALGTTSSIINASSTFLSILLAALAFRQERLTPRKILGCVLGFGGVVLVNLGSLRTGGGFALNGEGFIFLSALSGAVVTCLLRLFTQDHDAVMLSGWQFMLGGLVLAGAGLSLGGHLSLPGPSGAALILYMGFISACAYSLSSVMLSVNPVSRIAVFRFMTPVFGFLLSAALLGEAKSIDPARSLIALALVAAGIIVVNVALPAQPRGATREGVRR